MTPPICHFYLRHVVALLVATVAAFSLGCLSTTKYHAKTPASENKNIYRRTGEADVDESAASDNPYSPSSPMRREYDEFRKWVWENKKIVALSPSGNPQDLLDLSGTLEAKGVSKISTELLEQRLSSVNKIIASLDAHTCSTLIRGGFNLSEFTIQAFPVMNSFDEGEAKAWIQVNKAAIEAQLAGSPNIVLSTEDATLAIIKIARLSNASQSKIYFSGLASLKTASDEDACATARTLYSKGNALPEPYRGHIARLLLTGRNGNEKIYHSE
ncbi:hypothetical protein [Paraburkholderia dioscoreae]|uniref:Lipoprotein n=1 Tax=Paraburkholderia dioscoreae TaxID=2604047 RepID=A0A5Q4ZFZ0_9BURK|nr:hypothetical protein [Paraburkholderia dioscoreae]VVD28580.1 conserved exported protein of unknown function [Paraburkholderia dioscoreae]